MTDRLTERAEARASGLLTRRFGSGLFWVVISALCQRGGLILVGFILGRATGALALGQFSVALGTAMAAAMISGAPLGVTATRMIAVHLVTAPQRVGRTVVLLALATFGVTTPLLAAGLLLPEWIAGHLLHDQAIAPLVRLASPLVLLLAAHLLVTGILAGFEAFAILSRVSALGGGLSTGAALAGFAAADVEGAIVGWQAGLLVQFLVGAKTAARVAATHGIVLQMADLSGERGLFLRFGLPAAIGAALVEPVNWFCGTLLLRQPDGYAEMGVFQAANQWFIAVIFLPNMLSQANLPILTSLLAENRLRDGRRLLLIGIGANILVCALLFAAAVGLSDRVMAAYGQDFAGRGTVLLICAGTALLAGPQLPAGNLLFSVGRVWTGAWMNAAWAACFIGASILLVPNGADGLALARLLAYGAHMLWTFGFLTALLTRRSGLVQVAS